jgi:hypothetical protein
MTMTLVPSMRFKHGGASFQNLKSLMVNASMIGNDFEYPKNPNLEGI